MCLSRPVLCNSSIHPTVGIFTALNRKQYQTIVEINWLNIFVVFENKLRIKCAIVIEEGLICGPTTTHTTPYAMLLLQTTRFLFRFSTKWLVPWEGVVNGPILFWALNKNNNNISNKIVLRDRLNLHLCCKWIKQKGFSCKAFCILWSNTIQLKARTQLTFHWSWSGVSYLLEYEHKDACPCMWSPFESTSIIIINMLCQLKWMFDMKISIKGFVLECRHKCSPEVFRFIFHADCRFIPLLIIWKARRNNI